MTSGLSNLITLSLVSFSISANITQKFLLFFFLKKDKVHLFLAMEFCAGGDLRALLDNVAFDEKATRFYSAEIVTAVNCLHSKGFVHRDLKPV